MTEVVHADIFFFITSFVTVVLGLLFAVALFFVIKILRDIQAVSKKVRKASDDLEQDFAQLRSAVKGEGVRVKTVFDLFVGFVTSRFRAAPRRKTKKVDETEEL